ncbi:MAG: hypothetical protein FWD22_01760 [Treponema sp.]|nr:hypothetical protein [Treponema sp.]
MYVQNVIRKYTILVSAVFITLLLGGCEAMDAILPSAGTYKLNVQINDIPLDECSYAKHGDIINPFFEESVSEDPDITALMVFLRDSKGEIKGWRVIYNLDPEAAKIAQEQLKSVSKVSDDNTDENDSEKSGDFSESAEPAEAQESAPEKNGDEKIIPIANFNDMPAFPIPGNLPMGRYTMISQVMSGKDILQRTEKTFFYLGKTVFYFNGINVFLPGISDSAQLIPRGATVMLEVDLFFDKLLDPYIVWFDGRNKISEGYFSEGAGQLFWKAPEQSGFFALRAEIFPAESLDELSGYQKEISLLVSSQAIDVHLISANVPQLTHWYTLESSLFDSRTPAAADRALKPAGSNKIKWMGLNGTYGIASGFNNVFSLPKIPVLNEGIETWQALFRFSSLSSGGILSVLFGSSDDIRINLSMEEEKFILKLISPLKTVSQIISLPAASDESSEEIPGIKKDNSFITAGINFSVNKGLLTAQINIIGDFIDNELITKPIALNVDVLKDFQIMLGFLQEPAAEPDSPAEQANVFVPAEFNVLWDEFALYYMPPMDIIAAELKPIINENQPVSAADY